MVDDIEVDLKMALRDSEIATRPYVIVNPLLAKHLPSTPSESIKYFEKLGRKVEKKCSNERVLVIGFAETATAVGAAVASCLSNAVYVHTTREELDISKSGQCERVADFFEEHSHAKNQSLYLFGEYRSLSEYDRIVFVEDEITTGKTILNFLKQINYSGKITVSALVFNGFDEAVFNEYDADFSCLTKVGYVHDMEVEWSANPRMGIMAESYSEQCTKMASKIAEGISKAHINDKDILVVGTEEFMYPALALGCILEGSARSVKSQSTTRSPLLPKENYAIHKKSVFSSVYDSNRTTYLYNIKKYDTVIIVTDASGCDNSELVRAIQNEGNQTIYYVRFKYGS